MIETRLRRYRVTAAVCAALALFGFWLAALQAGTTSIDIETEPNGSTAQANTLSFSTDGIAIVRGAITPATDLDFFKFDGNAGDRIWICVDTGPTQITPAEPDTKSHDARLTLIGPDGLGALEVTLEVDEGDGNGNGCTAIPANSTVSAGASSIAGASLLATGTHYVRMEEPPTNGSKVVDAYRLIVVKTTTSPGLESEVNDTFGQADTLVIGANAVGFVDGSTASSGDVDYFSVQANAGDLIIVTLDANPSGAAAVDLSAELYATDGTTLLFESETSGSFNQSDRAAEAFCYTAPATGTFFVKVSTNFGNGGAYRLMVAATNISRVWSGSGAWSTAANWVGGIAPVANDSLLFADAGAFPGTTQNDLGAGGTFGAIFFTRAGFTISGNQLVLTGGITTSHPTGTSTVGLPIQLGSAQTFGSGTGSTLSFTSFSSIDTAGSTLSIAGDGTQTYASPITGSGGLVKDGTGTATLSANNSYTGTTTVNAGRLDVNGTQGNSAVTVNGSPSPATTTLGGSGTVASIAVGASDSKTISPGAATGTTTAQLRASGNVAFVSASPGATPATFHADLNGTSAGSNYDQLIVGGTVTLGNATLDLALGFTPSPGTAFTIIDNQGSQGVSGTFNGLPEGAIMAISGQSLQITYSGGTGNDVLLTAVQVTTNDLFAVTPTNTLIRTSTSAPSVLTSSVAISNLQSGESILAIDFRPATGELYGLGGTGRLYAINTTTGAAIERVAGLNLGLGVAFGLTIDLNSDTARIVSNQRLNLTVNLATSAATTRSDLSYAGGDPNFTTTPAVVGLSHTVTSVSNPSVSQVLAIDSATDSLVRLGGAANTPDDGQLTTLGALSAGFDVGPEVGLAIKATNQAFASLTPAAGGNASLYTINTVGGNATLVGGFGQAIRDIAVVPAGVFTFSAASFSQAEQGGSATIDVTRTGTFGSASVSYATGDGNAVAPADYTASSGTLTFAEGQFTASFTVPLVNDSLHELNETLNLTLSNPTGGAVLGAPSTATLMIGDNDPAPSVSIGDTSVIEGNSGTTNATFTLTLSALSGTAATVGYATAPQTATPDVDYASATGSVTFAAGETTKTLTILVLGDLLAESDETFVVNLSSPVEATLADAQGAGTIVNDDVAEVVRFVTSTAAVNENAGSVTVTVSRSGSLSGAVTANYATSDGTATVDADYTAAGGTLTFANGESSKPITVPILLDAVSEANETVILTLSAPSSGAIIGSPSTMTVAIVDQGPMIGSVYPTAGLASGGTKVTLTGVNFSEGMTVLFDASAATVVRVVNGTTATAVTPAHVAGFVNVQTTLAGVTGTLPAGYQYVPAAPNGTVDSDGDTLPDEWELKYSLDPLVAADASFDPDGDLLSNLQERAADSHPRGLVTRYLAEGATSTFFETRLALLNPTAAPAAVLLRYLQTTGQVLTRFVSISPLTRITIDAAATLGGGTAEFSTTIEADETVVVDRTMIWDRLTGYGSHAETSIGSPSTTWYLAEGATHSNFNLFYLLQNPTSNAAAVEVTYLLPAPAAPVVRTYSVGPNSRQNIWVNLIPSLASTDVSAIVRSTNGVPIIVERAMYLDAQGQMFGAGHDSAGVTAPATDWFLAEGATGDYFDLFILVANPNATDATLEVRFLLSSGTVITRNYVATANSRFNIWVDTVDAQLANAAVSTTIRSTNGVPVIAERAMWWPGTVATWREAHNSPGATQTGTSWALAEGEQGGTPGWETYILIANTSAFSDSVRVTLIYEDGSTEQRTFSVNASSRFNVAVGFELPNAVGRRFGAIVESLGAIPAQIVVERAMYSNAAGIVWAAGTNALATRLQ